MAPRRPRQSDKGKVLQIPVQNHKANEWVLISIWIEAVGFFLQVVFRAIDYGKMTELNSPESGTNTIEPPIHFT